MRYRFGDYVLDTQRHELHHAGVPIKLRRKVFQVLVYLLVHRDRVVSKQELTGQEQRLMAAMKKVEGELNDDLHAKVTTLLVELSAYNVMRLLNELQTERARMAFGKA